MDPGKSTILSPQTASKGFLAAWPEHPLPFEIVRRPTVQQTFLQFEEHLCDRVFVSRFGEISIKAGHFFTLVANSSSELKKGWVKAAKTPEHARELARNGELLHSDISGYEFSRAERIRLVGDIIECPHLILSPISLLRDEKQRYLHVKRYAGHKSSVLLCVTSIEEGGRLGLRSFHLRDPTINWLKKYKSAWRCESLQNLVWEG